MVGDEVVLVLNKTEAGLVYGHMADLCVDILSHTSDIADWNDDEISAAKTLHQKLKPLLEFYSNSALALK